LQVEKLTCRWSNSCWNIRAGRPDKLTENRVPLTSRALIFTDSGRYTAIMRLVKVGMK